MSDELDMTPHLTLTPEADAAAAAAPAAPEPPPLTLEPNAAAQAAALIQELKELGEDIRVQLQGIVETLGTLPGRAESLRQDFITMDDQIQALISSVQDTLDDFGDEMDTMREDGTE